MTTKIDFVATNAKTKEVHLYKGGRLFIVQDFKSPRQFMEYLCLQNGTTLEGCYIASGILLSQSYKRPIYIGGKCNQIFIPTSSIKNRQCVWISLDYLMNSTLQTFNLHGYEEISVARWQKHLADGVALNRAIFNHTTVMGA